MNDLKDLKDYRICVEKMLPQHQNILNEIKMTSNSEKHFEKLKAAFYTQKLWQPNSTIRIKFLQNPPSNLERTPLNRILNAKDAYGNLLKVDPLQKVVNNMPIENAIIQIVTQHIQPFVSVNLVFVNPNQNADIKISFDPNGGAWSYIGTVCLQTSQNEPTMNFGWFDVSTVIHEFGHSLGMIHEHQNPKGNTIQWNVPVVYQWAQRTQGWDQSTTYSNIIQKYSSNSINGSKFDPESIMLYFFPGSLTLNNKGTHQNLRLSINDVLYLNSMYPTKNISTRLSPNAFYLKAYGEQINLSKELFVQQNNNNYKFTKKHFKKDNILMFYCAIISFIFLVFIVLFSYKK